MSSRILTLPSERLDDAVRAFDAIVGEASEDMAGALDSDPELLPAIVDMLRPSFNAYLVERASLALSHIASSPKWTFRVVFEGEASLLADELLLPLKQLVFPDAARDD